MLTQGRIDEGVAFLEGVRDTWTGLNSFMDTHLWWHLALFYLSQGRFDDALMVYDQHCWTQEKDYSQDQVGAVSLLARLELAGIDVGERWADVADHLARRGEDVVQPFLTLQYLYGLARAGRAEADPLLAAVRRMAATAPDFARPAWRDAALPAAEGLVAHARGDFEAAVQGLRIALPRLIEVGGSHAQRDFFEQIALNATIRSGRLSEAQQALELRRAFDPDGVPLNRTLAEVYDRLGLPIEAAKARARALRRQAEAA
jgi:tetratricopeptide (TPR) repeat protein